MGSTHTHMEYDTGLLGLPDALQADLLLYLDPVSIVVAILAGGTLAKRLHGWRQSQVYPRYVNACSIVARKLPKSIVAPRQR